MLIRLETGPEYRHVYQYMKPVLFPSHYPAIMDFRVSGGKLYVLTYGRREHKAEFHVLDLQGKLLKAVFLPLQQKNAFTLYPYTIHNSTLYQLLENEETETWELQAVSLKRVVE